jgi:hypothetical protein
MRRTLLIGFCTLFALIAAGDVSAEGTSDLGPASAASSSELSDPVLPPLGAEYCSCSCNGYLYEELVFVQAPVSGNCAELEGLPCEGVTAWPYGGPAPYPRNSTMFACFPA